MGQRDSQVLILTESSRAPWIATSAAATFSLSLRVATETPADLSVVRTPSIASRAAAVASA
jgi:hypothetical protein